MNESCRVETERFETLAVVRTEGYINREGGEQIERCVAELLEAGVSRIVLNLERTKIVNSIGISILIEVLERMMERKGALAFCRLTPTIDKTFRIMGLAQYAGIHATEEEARSALSAIA
jgi:anti-anti-sigma factor